MGWRRKNTMLYGHTLPVTDDSKFSFERLLTDTLRIDFLNGGAAESPANYSTGWRTLPYGFAAQWQDVELRMDIDGGRQGIAMPGSGIFIPPGVRHRVTVVSRRPTPVRWVHLRVTAFGGIDLLSRLFEGSILSRKAGDQLGDSIESLAALYDAPTANLATIAQRKALCYVLLADLLTWTPPRPDALAALHGVSRVQPVLDYVREHIAGDLSRDTLASQLNLSPTRFHTVFKDVLGIAPVSYVAGVRLQVAMQLLLDTEIPIARIGGMVGYPDPFHFSRIFKTEAGVSPLQYRRQVRQTLFRVAPGVAVEG